MLVFNFMAIWIMTDHPLNTKAVVEHSKITSPKLFGHRNDLFHLKKGH